MKRKRKQNSNLDKRPKKRQKTTQKTFEKFYAKMSDKKRMDHIKMLMDSAKNKLFLLKGTMSMAFVESYKCLYNDLEENSKDLFTKKYAVQKLKNTIYPDLIIE